MALNTLTVAEINAQINAIVGLPGYPVIDVSYITRLNALEAEIQRRQPGNKVNSINVSLNCLILIFC